MSGDGPYGLVTSKKEQHMPGILRRTRNALAITLFVAGPIAAAVVPSSALAVDTMTSTDAPDLASARSKIKAKDYQAAIAELRGLADTHQSPDVYSLLGFSLRKTGDYATALSFYRKALDFDANHKGAREYLGELYVETGDLAKAREQLTVLTKLCPQGCEEREDLEKALESVPRGK